MQTQDVKYREKQLYKNTGILAIGTLCSKAFQFFLLPLYTNVLSTEEYGRIDLLTTIASLIIPIVTMQVSSAVFRFIIDCDDKMSKEKVISSSFCIEIIALSVSTAVILLFNYFITIQYCAAFLAFIVTSVCNDYIQNVIRGLGNNLVYSALSFITVATSVLFNVLFIVGFQMNGEAILLASTLSYFIGTLWAVNRLKIWKYIKISKVSSKTCNELIRYCFPLIPNAISWWIANASDRLLINIYLGASFNGIYAAANKIPALYTTLFNVFNLAWSESVSRGSDSKAQELFVNEILEKCIRMFGCICLGIIACIAVFFDVLIGPKYSEAYNHIWILMLAIFINSLCSIFGGIFTAFKKSKIIGASTVFGAVVNILVNLMLINVIGIYAASISTLVSYIVILIIRYYFSKQLIDIKWPTKSIAMLIVAFVVISVGYFSCIFALKIFCLGFAVIWSIVNNKELLVTVLYGLRNKITHYKEC